MNDSSQYKINVPENFRYNDDHVWMEYSEDGFIKCGLTEFLCETAGEIIEINFIRNILNMEVNSNDPILSIESLNAFITIKSPIPGIVVEINQNSMDTPGLLNTDPYGEGWLFVISSDNVSDFELQMHHDEYEYLVMKEKEDMELI
ncbi:MAG TPA: hypothetical protein P5120_00480 [Spirochaetota bacterium]|nr:hypothetical protein [Spirochaetota bacterium]HPF04443.1 hypothetical protein [Spirochaetota bacterium]HPJ40785.1 hypothetical protein [Spirochaetota bacterium]HRX45968.1 hypothetical protein [Spirochaetota bacterium]